MWKAATSKRAAGRKKRKKRSVASSRRSNAARRGATPSPGRRGQARERRGGPPTACSNPGARRSGCGTAAGASCADEPRHTGLAGRRVDPGGRDLLHRPRDRAAFLRVAGDCGHLGTAQRTARADHLGECRRPGAGRADLRTGGRTNWPGEGHQHLSRHVRDHEPAMRRRVGYRLVHGISRDPRHGDERRDGGCGHLFVRIHRRPQSRPHLVAVSAQHANRAGIGLAGRTGNSGGIGLEISVSAGRNSPDPHRVHLAHAPRVAALAGRRRERRCAR